MVTFKQETQNPKELEEFLQFIRDRRIRCYCELGLYAGTTFKAVYETLKDLYGSTEFLMIGVDYPTNQAAFAHLTQTVIPPIQEDLGDNLRFLVGNSTDPQIVEGVLEALKDTPKFGEALVFIDGDHSYLQSRNDFLAYKEHFQFIAFNDVSLRTTSKNIQKHGHDVATVAHLFDGLTLDLPPENYLMIEDPQAQNPRGIGVLF